MGEEEEQADVHTPESLTSAVAAAGFQAGPAEDLHPGPSHQPGLVRFSLLTSVLGFFWVLTCFSQIIFRTPGEF